MEFANVGAHCEHPGCNQRDFLPFRCDCCSKLFCLSHRSYRAHTCPKAGSKETHAIDCPLCAGSIRITGDEDPNVAFERHVATLCTPARRKERKHKKRCGAAKCHKKLTATNTFKCPDCGIEVCLTHRYGDAHKCAGRRAGRASSAKAGFLSRFTAPRATSRQAREAEAAAANRAAAEAKARRARRQRGTAARAVDPSNTLRGSAAARMRRSDRQPHGGSASTAAAAAAPAPSALLAGAGRGREVCPTCSARFENVMDLVAHVESWHAAPTAPTASRAATRAAAPAPVPAASSAGGATPCPHCGAAFYNPVDLVTHCEGGHCPHTRRAQPQQQQQSSCMVS